MHQRFNYEIIVKVEREGLLTVPIAAFHVRGGLSPTTDFAQQLGESFTRNLAGIRPRLEKAREK